MLVSSEEERVVRRVWRAVGDVIVNSERGGACC